MAEKFLIGIEDRDSVAPAIRVPASPNKVLRVFASEVLAHGTIIASSAPLDLVTSDKVKLSPALLLDTAVGNVNLGTCQSGAPIFRIKDMRSVSKALRIIPL